MITLIQRATLHPERVAIKFHQKTYTYGQLLEQSQQLAMGLLDGENDLQEARVAFMVAPGFNYVLCQWAIWQAGGVAVPLCVSHPLPSLQYTISDSQASIVLYSKEFEEVLKPLTQNTSLTFVCVEQATQTAAKAVWLPQVSAERSAMILYTSGTTSLPKGVVSTHSNIEAQVSCLVKAWEWTQADHILCILPLHHVHGIINVISCALWSGATCEFLKKFSAEAVFDAFAEGHINLFMAVPTIYFKLIAHLEQLNENDRNALKATMQKFRLMVSGSAALPVSVMEKWQALSGQILLERYGMTEIGMAISNPYHGERKPGHIGMPLPGVQVRLCDDNDHLIQDEPGEIQIKGPTVFKAYYNKPEATQKAFTADGWFKTGDIAEIVAGYYKILGRDSIDIIKSGGYKISALEIEEVLRQHPLVADCSVLGQANEEWGEIVVAAIVSKATDIDTAALNSWLRTQIPAYKVPRQYKILEELPRNAMGKVTKNDLKALFN